MNLGHIAYAMKDIVKDETRLNAFVLDSGQPVEIVRNLTNVTFLATLPKEIIDILSNKLTEAGYVEEVSGGRPYAGNQYSMIA